MSKHLTCKVTTNESSRYFAIESYLLQCACTNDDGTVRDITVSKFYTQNESSFILEYRSNYGLTIYDVFQKIQNIINNPTTSLKDVALLSDSNTAQNIIAVATATCRSGSEYATIPCALLCAFRDELPTGSGTYPPYIASIIQAHIRRLIAGMSDEAYSSLCDNWKTCIAKTLNSEIIYSNSPIE